MKNKISKLLFLTLLICSINVLSQNLQSDKITNPAFDPKVISADVATLGKYTSMEVNLNTGTPDISIPLYTLDYAGMQIPISLSYDASGIKVEDVSSSVGLKWTLIVGGMVGRYVKGAPDEGTSKSPDPLMPSCVSTPLADLGCNGYYIDNGMQKFYNTFPSISDSRKVCEYDLFHKQVADGLKDTQPDLFFFNSLGHSGRFFFDNNKNAKLFTEGDYKINTFLVHESIPNLYVDHFEWKIIAPNGDQMWFGQNHAIERSLSLGQGDNANVYSIPYTANAWNLTKLINGKNQKEINFNYINSSYKTITISNGSFIEESETLSPLAGSSGPTRSPNETYAYAKAFRAGGVVEDQNILKTDNYMEHPMLQNIVAGDYEVIFYYSERQDLLENAKKLDKMEVFYKTEKIKQIVFNYDYFNFTGNNINLNSFILIDASVTAIINASKKRLKLISIEEKDIINVTIKKHQFEYDESFELPSTISFAKDIWGFFNGAYLNKSLYPKYNQFESVIPSQYYSTNLLAKAAISRKVNPAYSKVGTLTKIIYPTGGSVEFEFENHRSSSPVYSIPGENYQWITLTNGLSSTYPSNITQYPNIDKFKIEGNFWKGSYSSGTGIPSNCVYCGFENVKGIEVLDANGVTLFQKLYGSMVNNSINQVVSPLPFSFIYDPETSSTQHNLTNITIKATSALSNIMGSNGFYPTCFMSTSTLSIFGPVTPVYSANDYLVGGLRIKNIFHNDANNSLLYNKSYSYEVESLINKPTFTKVQSFTIDVTRGGLIPLSEVVNHFSNLNTTLEGTAFYVTPGYNPQELDFSGPHISYGKTIEHFNNTKIEYSFGFAQSYEEANAYSNLNNVPYKPKFQTSLAGKLLFKKYFNDQNQSLKSEQFIYTRSAGASSSQSKIMSRFSIFPGTGGFFVNPSIDYIMQTEYVKLQKTINIDYLNGQEIKTEINYFQDSPNHHQNTRIEKTNSDNEILKSEYQYVPDLLASGKPFMQDLKNANRINQPIISKEYNGSILLSQSETVFAKDDTTSNLLLPKYLYQAKFPNTLPNLLTIDQLEKKITYDNYDTIGNILQYTPENGIPTSIIWGYNKTLPIAKIENTTNAQIQTALGMNLSDVTEANMSIINALRASLPNAMVTTYTHIPLVGVSTITDPKGDTITYTYDSFNRLKEVKDKNGNILSENEYYFRPQ